MGGGRRRAGHHVRDGRHHVVEPEDPAPRGPQRARGGRGLGDPPDRSSYESSFSTSVRLADSRSGIFATSLPPASAKSGRPPPRPPTIGASCFTTSPAGTFFVRSGVTPTTIDTLPSDGHARTTTPLLSASRCRSTSARRPSLSRPDTSRATSFTPATSTTSSLDAVPPPPN